MPVDIDEYCKAYIPNPQWTAWKIANRGNRYTLNTNPKVIRCPCRKFQHRAGPNPKGKCECFHDKKRHEHYYFYRG